jgi:Family of unknown function (DUF5317)
MSGLASAGTTVVLALLAVLGGAGLGHWWGSRHPVGASPPVVGWSLIAGGVGLRLAVEAVSLPGAAALVVASHGLLVAACLANRGRTGVAVITLGLVVMLAPTVLNGGMPVSRDALASIGSAAPPPELPGGRHVEVDRDRLAILGDVLPLPSGGRPVSFGELIALAGLADVAFRSAGQLAGRRLHRLGVLRSVPGDPTAHERGPWSDLDLSDLEAEAPTVVVLGPAPASPVASHLRSAGRAVRTAPVASYPGTARGTAIARRELRPTEWRPRTVGADDQEGDESA